jgi:Zn-dependent peptidase ImmA (M78 family)
MLVKDKARLDAAEVLRDAWSAGFPVDPKRIADHLGMIVTVLPLDRNISGMLRVDEGEAEIFVSSDDTAPRQRFTIAHEIGHFIERTSRGVLDFNFIDYRSGDNYNLHEFYADEFAGALLMPTVELNRVLAEGMPLPLIAKHFGVSLPAAKKRIERHQVG